MGKSKKKKLLKKLEREIVEQKKYSEKEIEETERELQEGTEETDEGLGIEKMEEKGEEAYPEIQEVEKDPDEEDEE